MASTKQRKVYEGIGGKYEDSAKKWLEGRKFSVDESFSKPHNDYFDILAHRGRVKWIIEVKGGEKPKVAINNLAKMVDTPNINKVGLLFMRSTREPPPLFFELSKMSVAGLKAWKKIRSSNG